MPPLDPCRGRDGACPALPPTSPSRVDGSRTTPASCARSRLARATEAAFSRRSGSRRLAVSWTLSGPREVCSMLRRLGCTTTIILGALVATFFPTATAGAALKPTVGTYEVYVSQSAPFSWVLERNHTVASAGVSDPSSSWSVLRHVVTVHLEGSPAGPIICLHAGQPPNCLASSTYVGPKSVNGIASSTDQGTVTDYVGTEAVLSDSFYAVRTGGVRAGWLSILHGGVALPAAVPL